MPPPTPFVGRMMRAQANFLETFPIAAAAILIVQVAGLNSSLTATGAVVWLIARVAYWLVYALGIPVLRSVLFATSILGIGMMLWPALGQLINEFIQVANFSHGGLLDIFHPDTADHALDQGS